MRLRYSIVSLAIVCAILWILESSRLAAQSSRFHDAPASGDQMKNPYAGQASAAAAGQKLYATRCASCHGVNGQGTGNVPALAQSTLRAVPDGELFWFITNGSVSNGMPSWASLPKQERWQIVTYLESSNAFKGTASPPASASQPVQTNDPPPQPPFTDFRYEAPGNTRRITAQNLPAPYATRSSANGPELVGRPADAWPKALPGFSVQQFAAGLDNPRLLTTAPNGDIFLAESNAGQIKIFRGMTADGKAEQTSVFATGLKMPYGIAFYPPGADPQWVYIGNTNSVLRFPYQNGDLKARGPAEHIADLPNGSGHWTRDIRFTPDGKKMFVSVGSASNVDDPDTCPRGKIEPIFWNSIQTVRP